MYKYLVFLLILFPFIFSLPLQRREVWVEIHDASPGYGVEKLSEVMSVLDRHDVDRKFIFVIPNHDNVTPLRMYPEFGRFLKDSEKRGYIIGAHGYSHQGFEFYTSSEKASDLVDALDEEFDYVGVKPRVFFPPRYLIKRGVLDVLNNRFDGVFLFDSVFVGSVPLVYGVHEFTWFDVDHRVSLFLAKMSYLSSRQGVFRLSVHVGAVNSPENLMFLDEFLSWSYQSWGGLNIS